MGGWGLRAGEEGREGERERERECVCERERARERNRESEIERERERRVKRTSSLSHAHMHTYTQHVTHTPGSMYSQMEGQSWVWALLLSYFLFLGPLFLVSKS